MADLSSLKAGLKSLLKPDKDKTVDKQAEELAVLIDAFVKSGDIAVTVQGVKTAGSPGAQTQTLPVQAKGKWS